MKRVLLALAVVLAVVAPVFGISDIGNPNVSRLWRETETGDRFTCTAFYVRSPVDNSTMEDRSWILSAGHCADAQYIKRNADVWFFSAVTWAYRTVNFRTKLADFAIGIVADPEGMRGKSENRGFWLAEAMPEKGTVYVHGFPYGVERVNVAHVFPKGQFGDIPEQIQVTIPESTRVIVAPSGEIRPGSSGSPVLDTQGRVVGILWGMYSACDISPAKNPCSIEYGLVTPIEVVREAFLKIVSDNGRPFGTKTGR